MRGLVRELDDSVIERDYQKIALTKPEVERIVKAAGGVAPVLNTRHAFAKENGWKDAPPSRATFAAAVTKTPNLLRRPILLVAAAVVIGKDEAAVRAALG